MAQSQLELVYRKVSELIPYARNSRTHDEAQVAQIAASIREFGFTNPILIDESSGIVAGHGRVLAALKLKMEQVPTITLVGLTETQRRAYVIADNKLALNAGWNFEMLAVEIDELNDEEYDLSVLGFTTEEINELIGTPNEPPGNDDGVVAVEDNAVSEYGDVWLLGEHRVMCGDSTSADDVAKLMNGAIANLIHADPPYGMGKQADGVANDNIYGEKLDAFQMSWWRAFRPHLASNASAYIWGNAPDLWRLWYAGGLASTEAFELRNEIVWDKKNIAGMKSPDLTQYPEATERCLFFQFGHQFIGNVNADDFPEAWEPLRSYMHAEADSAGMKSQDIKRLCGVQMYGHWFTKSQFTLIPEKHYATLQKEYPGQFEREWKELKREWDRVKGSARTVINGKLDGIRSYFDNAHDIMRDVWDFPRVVGEDRHGHATPKPVAMMERVMRSSLPEDGLCVEPFGGSGSTLIGADRTGRICYSMELQATYVDVIVKRWQSLTGKQATLEGDGRTFDEIVDEREQAAA